MTYRLSELAATELGDTKLYHYEALGDERFQEFCQALLVASFPNVQCLPVGQPDGGRDAFRLRRLIKDQASSELIVFQVKFVKHSAETKEARSFVSDIVKGEKVKIERLKRAGLKTYYLITNVRGTAHLDVGSIDKLNKMMSEELGIDCHCWWRDDLDRRLDNSPNIKWSYPEILKATDLLGALVNGHLGEDEERRRGAIRAYITSQFDDDQELKFKQTELRSNMTELYVDLPMQRSVELLDYRMDSSRLDLQRARYQQLNFSNGLFFELEDREMLAAKHFILFNFDSSRNKIVLEGAPGQGKSTVTQYICQYMRMRLLGRETDLIQMPAGFLNARVRIPFRVDLRDLAKWLAGVNPFQPKPTNLEEKEPRSLEGFLAGQIRFFSGGHDFNVSDLTAVAKASHLLLALDGFDEVADVEHRKQLVLEIGRGVTRLSNAGGYSVQTIVTSRPAAFAKSIRFPRDQWIYFELLPLQSTQVADYSKKWMKAKGIKEADQASLNRILSAKLKEAHTQFLAKNPMQLTILLSLIHNRGASLPEKRTAMYDAYMDMFFSRESEKSDVVRDNRDLLIDIHRYLAWKLQTSAESGENGSIERNDLRQVLLIYLDTQGEDTSIVGDLFDGVIERVGALVSRVQETYEFEVQPLREYFAARHLYDTAPYSPAGDERSGTKLDRFRALVANPYWLNVARFYGGCFSKGEISALVDELSEISMVPQYKLTSHTRSVALMLLSDWVFTQYQPAVKKIVELICERPQLRQLLANGEQAGAAGWSALPDRSGRADFVNKLWEHSAGTVLSDERQALAGVIVNNSDFSERASRWNDSRALFSNQDWIKFGSWLRLFSDENFKDLQILQEPFEPSIIVALLENNRFNYLEFSEMRQQAKCFLLTCVKFPIVSPKIENDNYGILWWMAKIFSYLQYSWAHTEQTNHTLRQVLYHNTGMGYLINDGSPIVDEIPSEITVPERRAIEAYYQFLDTETSMLSSNIEPWNELVEALRTAWGDCAAIDRIAFSGAGIKSRENVLANFALEKDTSLVRAARFARLKSGAPKWWEDQLNSEKNSAQVVRLLLLLWLWGTRRTILKLQNVLAVHLNAISEDSWIDLCKDFRVTRSGRSSAEERNNLLKSELKKLAALGSRVSMFLGLKLTPEDRYALGIMLVELKMPLGTPEIQFAMDAIGGIDGDSATLKQSLPHVKELYLKGGFSRIGSSHKENPISTEVATLVSLDAANYPLPLLAISDSHLRSLVGADAVKLIDIANLEHWFRN